MFIDEKLPRIVHMARMDTQAMQSRKDDWCIWRLFACLWHLVGYV